MDDAGSRMYGFAECLFPLRRSITGDGLRESLRMIGEKIPIRMIGIPSGTKVFDWQIPQEWLVREAWIRDGDGREIVNLQNHNLHLVGYSTPIHTHMTLNDLLPHLHSKPEQPDVIPYRTGYYNHDWGFCVPYHLLEQLDDGNYEVFIDSELIDGELNYGELFIPGSSDEEILISCHCCHPSMANDNLSGMVLATELAARMLEQPLRHSYRFLFVPGTIGSIAWLAGNQNSISKIIGGLVLACVGDSGPLTYKKSRHGNSIMDRAVALTFRNHCPDAEIREFVPYGYDERQYGSPGINLAVGCLSRTAYGCFPEYHTSADDMSFITAKALQDTLENLERIFFTVEKCRRYLNLKPMTEPQLGKYGLYGMTGGNKTGNFDEMALLWVLNLSDGNHDLMSVAEMSGIDFGEIHCAALRLSEAGLLRELSD